jgi:hypothetical protein
VKRICVIMLKTTLAILMSMLLLAPPSGRPPMGPLKRYEPRMYDLTFGATITTLQQQYAPDRRTYTLNNAPIVMPVIFLGTFSKVDASTVTPHLWLGSREDAGIKQRTEMKTGMPFQTTLAVMTVDQFTGFALRWNLQYAVQVWSSEIDDAAAANIAWPKEWPQEVKDGLQPQMFVESDDPIFKQTVHRVSQGKLRFVPPYLAAKDLVRYAINEVQMTGDGMKRGINRALLGLDVQGASQTAVDGRGSPNDLVCVCVAMLRAAGIPARPVIGVMEDPETNKNVFAVWAEFYLPDAGWVPFDPVAMRGKGIRTLDVRKAWPEFGTMKDLNRRIPLAYHFIPTASVEVPLNPAVWGWDPRPGSDFGSEQVISIGITSRGKGVDDPQ